MGKKDKTGGLGRSLVKDRFGHSNRKKTVDNGSMLHTTAIQDGYEWGRLNLQSVTEESSFQDFLSTAELANTEFQAEKLNLKMININSGVCTVTSSEMRVKEEKKHMEFKHLLRVPRRPKWTKDMKPEVVQDNERQSFLEWRRDLATLQEKDGLTITPYEKNLEFWRQLWRVLERSDILIQVVDARNPLLFRCEDLELYAKEMGIEICLLLLNKSDLLTEEQRKIWAEYFNKEKIRTVFFSATLAAEKVSSVNSELHKIVEEDSNEQCVNNDSDDDIVTENERENANIENENINKCMNNETLDVSDLKNEIKSLEESVDETAEKIKNIITDVENLLSKKIYDDVEIKKGLEYNENKNVSSANSITGVILEESICTDILDRDQLIELLRSFEIEKNGRICVGLVGYPNVGKSSTINYLMNAKKVSVSATPGKTKHFQTLMLEDDLMLCDCPGLVLPSFVCTKADMIVYGILPIDQMREYMDSVNIVTECLGNRYQAEKRLGILLPPASEDSDDLTPRNVLNAYAYSRGMMTGTGQPDCARAARVILRAAMKGIIPVAVPPPDCNFSHFMSSTYFNIPENEILQKRREMTPNEARALKMNETSEDVDKKFFGSCSLTASTKGVPGKFHGLPTERSYGDGEQQSNKPWKEFNKHVNKNKKQKLKKVYYYLDKH